MGLCPEDQAYMMRELAKDMKMTTPDTLTTERILNAAVGLGVPVEKYGWYKIEHGVWVTDHTVHIDATPADRKAIICEIVERLIERYVMPEKFQGTWFWSWNDDKKPVTAWEVYHEDFDTAAVNAALKVGGEG